MYIFAFVPNATIKENTVPGKFLVQEEYGGFLPEWSKKYKI